MEVNPTVLQFKLATMATTPETFTTDKLTLGDIAFKGDEEPSTAELCYDGKPFYFTFRSMRVAYEVKGTKYGKDIIKYETYHLPLEATRDGPEFGALQVFMTKVRELLFAQKGRMFNDPHKLRKASDIKIIHLLTDAVTKDDKTYEPLFQPVVNQHWAKIGKENKPTDEFNVQCDTVDLIGRWMTDVKVTTDNIAGVIEANSIVAGAYFFKEVKILSDDRVIITPTVKQLVVYKQPPLETDYLAKGTLRSLLSVEKPENVENLVWNPKKRVFEEHEPDTSLRGLIGSPIASDAEKKDKSKKAKKAKKSED